MNYEFRPVTPVLQGARGSSKNPKSRVSPLLKRRNSFLAVERRAGCTAGERRAEGMRLNRCQHEDPGYRFDGVHEMALVERDADPPRLEAIEEGFLTGHVPAAVTGAVGQDIDASIGVR